MDIAVRSNNINLRVGLKIRRLREEKGWTQEDLAFAADLHRAYIGQIEHGEKNISLTKMFGNKHAKK